MKNQQIRITIGICCFDAENTIADAINSALSQTWQNLEIIVCDDNSSDGSLKIIREFSTNHRNIKVIENDYNGGPAVSRNNIIKEATGELIAFFDDDDVSFNNRLEVQFSYIRSAEAEFKTKLIACFCSGQRIYPNGYVVDLHAIGSKGEVKPKGATVANYLLFYEKKSGIFYGSGTPTCSLMIRKNVFDKIGMFDPELRRLEDVDFAIRFALKGGTFVGCREKLFQQTSTYAADKSFEINLLAEQALVVKNTNYLKAKSRYHYSYRWPKLRYWYFKRNYRKFFIELCALFWRNPLPVIKHLVSTGPSRVIHDLKIWMK